MKYLLFFPIFIAVGCTTQQFKEIPAEPRSQITIYENTKQGIDSIITNSALTEFKNDYSKASRNKAFAQSVSGAWNWKSNRTSVEHAKTSALIGCQRNNKRSEDLYPCKVIHVNDSWVK